jgi:hypothetical protein
VRFTTVLKRLVGCEQAVPEDAWFDEEAQVMVVAVRPKSRVRRRCGICETRCARFDAGAGRRRWRHLDAAGLPLFLEADAPRVRPVVGTGSWSPRCPGPGTTSGTPTTSTSRSPDWPPSAPSPRPRG